MTQPELPKHFTLFFEIENRPRFDPLCGITSSNFKALLGEYDFTGDVRCQIYRQETGNCGNKHRHGFLGLTKDGREGLIGGICAKRYFDADKTFKSERNRVRAEINITQSLEKLSNLLADRGAFEVELQKQVSRLRTLRGLFQGLREQLAPSIRTDLESMAKTGNTEVLVEVQYVETNEDGKRHTDWVPFQVGSIEGVSIWLYSSSIGSLFKALHRLEKLLPQVELSRDAGKNKLKDWADVLSLLPQHALAIDAVEKAYKSFVRFDNLALLVFLVRSSSEQESTASIALQHNDGGSSSKASSRALVNKLQGEVRDANKGRNIRVPK